jgi:ubiquinone/menaquinone biosynthesis C-methylase UbiE
MLAEARHRQAAAGRAVAFVVGDAPPLACADGACDRCRAERVPRHPEDPGRAVAEMVRVVRPGGKKVVFARDWGVRCVDSPSPETTRAIPRAFSDGRRHGWIGRRLPRLCQGAGLVEVTCAPQAVHLD